MTIIGTQRCYLFGAGEYFDMPVTIGDTDFIIAVDGGLKHLEQHHIKPHLIIGDFDSYHTISSPDFNVIVFPEEKDDTDTAAALRESWRLGYRTFHIYGGTGSRLDHTLANIQCALEIACRGGRGFLYDRDIIITAIFNDEITFPSNSRGIVSVFSHSDIASGVCERGLRYSLTNATLENTFPLGISNEFIGSTNRNASYHLP